MARGKQDWSNPDYQTASVVVDTADTADRLLGFARIDTRGRVFYLDTFSEGVGGWELLADAGADNPVAKVVQGLGFAGPVAILLYPGLVDGEQSVMFRELYLGQAQRIGVEFGLTIGAPGVDFLLTFQYQVAGGTEYFGKLQYDLTANEWQVWTAAGWVQAFATNVNYNGLNFLVFKLVLDFATGMYDRLMEGEVQHNLETIAMPTAGSIAEGAARVLFAATAVSTDGGGAYLHYVILTKDEQ